MGMFVAAVSCWFSSRSLTVILLLGSTITDSTPGVEAAWNIFGSEYGFDGKDAAECEHLSTFDRRVLPLADKGLLQPHMVCVSLILCASGAR